MLALSLCLALSSLIPVHGAIGPRADLKLVNKVIRPDGFERSAILPGGKFPGPLIKGQVGDKFRINVIDALTDSTMPMATSIHWHGLFQRGTNWADGPAFVTQCPIIPNHSFEYAFETKQSGTYWYHSHFSTQYCDGLRGPLVIYDPQDPHRHLYDVDDESTILTLADWYHVPSPQVTGVPSPDSTLFNGVGRSKNGERVPLTVMNVQRGKRYRFRLISMACDPNYHFSIDHHQMTIIEADGENTQPLRVDSIQIFAGQRYSFILHANQKVDNYWIRANPNSGTPGFDNGMNSAILRYSGAPNTEPKTNQTPSTRPLVETNLHPLTNPMAPGKPWPGGADIVIDLNFTFSFDTLKFSTNGATFDPPTVPVLLQILSGAYDAQDLLPNGTVYTLPPNKVVELSMPAGVIGGPHPIHLHGHTFSVVRSAGNSTYNFRNPVRRDVVSIGDVSDKVTIRFVTDNAGPWFLHCHIDWHLDLGFAVVFAEDPKHTKQRNPVPPSWSKLCPLYDASKHNKLALTLPIPNRLPA